MYRDMQHKSILERTLPDALKLSIAQKIENNLFSKVFLNFNRSISLYCLNSDRKLRFLFY
jgi:hypothetical protein